MTKDSRPNAFYCFLNIVYYLKVINIDLAPSIWYNTIYWRKQGKISIPLRIEHIPPTIRLCYLLKIATYHYALSTPLVIRYDASNMSLFWAYYTRYMNMLSTEDSTHHYVSNASRPIWHAIYWRYWRGIIWIERTT